MQIPTKIYSTAKIKDYAEPYIQNLINYTFSAFDIHDCAYFNSQMEMLHLNKPNLWIQFRTGEIDRDKISGAIYPNISYKDKEGQYLKYCLSLLNVNYIDSYLIDMPPLSYRSQESAHIKLEEFQHR